MPTSRVSSFVDSLGVNVHMGYFDTPYGESSSIIAKLDYLGLHHVRDAAAWSGWVSPLAKLGEAGIHLNLMIGGHADTLSAQFSYLEKLAPYIATIEGANEVNYWPVTYNGQTGVNAAIQQQAYISQHLDSIAGLRDKPLVGFSVAAASNAQFAPYGDNSAPNDFGNAHVYFPAGTAPGDHLKTYVAMANQLTPGDRMFLTESGFPTNGSGPGNQGVSETTQAKYTLDLLMDAYKQGVVRTFLYELQDLFSDPGKTNQDKHYGLFRHDGSAKPAAVAIHNLTTILADEGVSAATFSTGTLNYSVSGLPSSGNHMLMQESNGNFDIVLWNEPAIWDDANSRDLTSAAQNVTVSLGGTFRTVNVYDPLAGSQPVKTYSDTSSLVLGVTDHPLIVETVGGASGTTSPPPAEPAAGLIGTQTVGSGSSMLVLKVSEDAYQGDARFTVRVDGQQVGDTLAAHASKDAGQYENIQIKGDWAAVSHKVEVSFLNDAWEGTAATDRNLYVESATFNSTSIAGSALGTVNGTESFSFSEAPGKLILHMSEDAWNGDAQFKLRVDGVQVGGIHTVTALHSKGQVQEFSFDGSWSAGEHKIEVQFLNDAYGGTASADRNLYVEAIEVGGTYRDLDFAMKSNETAHLEHIMFA
jgi:hypothetical protein